MAFKSQFSLIRFIYNLMRDGPKTIEEIIRENAFDQKKKTPRLKFNPFKRRSAFEKPGPVLLKTQRDSEPWRWLRDISLISDLFIWLSRCLWLAKVPLPLYWTVAIVFQCDHQRLRCSVFVAFTPSCWPWLSLLQDLSFKDGNFDFFTNASKTKGKSLSRFVKF